MEDERIGHDGSAKCILCGSPRLVPLSRYQRAHLVRCEDCSMVFAARIPTEDELARHYHDYGHAWCDSSITRHRYRELLVGFEPNRSTNRILDFGCGAGFFLEEARAHGWEAYGTEYSGFALEVARSKQLEVVAAPIGSDTFAEGFFDVVTAFEVFEHVRDPRDKVDLIAHLLRSGGLLYCTTPNFNALTRRVLGPRWNVIDYPEHLCYFTPRTLRRCLTGIGLVAESIRSTGVSLSWLRGQTVSVENGHVSSADEEIRALIETSPLLRATKHAANAVLSGTGMGDTLKGSFRRI